MKIRKALIMAAGLGTRFLPVTKTIQKEMIPVLNYPTIYYQVQDCVKAGVKEIVIVVNERNTQIRDFFTENDALRKYLKQRGKPELYDEMDKIQKMAEFKFVLQRESDPYGTAVPVMLAEQYLRDEEVFGVFTSDDIFFNRNEESELSNMIRFLECTGKKNLMSAIERPTEELHKYGVLSTKEESDVILLKDIVEKPASGEAPSNLSNISRYLVSSEIFDVLKTQKPNERIRELVIVDTMIELARRQGVVVYTPDGVYLDTGNPIGWLKANIFFAARDKAVRAELKDYLSGL